ncbi:MAG: NRDE family protein [Pirellulaceae bacterium]|nr:NRDE family protein [Pirellulaceae bacterium]
MCLLAIQYHVIPEVPILLAANREEFYDRPSRPPAIQSGKPRVLCGKDLQAGGTWLGINQHGVVIGACNRRKNNSVMVTRSRGVLCREMLKAHSAQAAVNIAMEELATGRYNGVNYICADFQAAFAVHGGNHYEAVPLEPGLNIIGNNDVNDLHDERVQMAKRLLTLQSLDSSVKFLAVSSRVFARSPIAPNKPSMVIREAERGTVSSTLLALGIKPRDSIYQFADGAPDQVDYKDHSPQLRDILSRGLREAQKRKLKEAQAANSQVHA